MMQTKSVIVSEFLFYGAEPNIAQVNLWAEELAAFNPEELMEAYKRLRNAHSRVPLPSNVKDELLGYLKADEAWGLLPRADRDSVIWNEPMRVAWAACKDLMESDQVAARMAFKTCYESEVLTKKYNNIKATWSLSEGTDKNQKNKVLSKAYERGWIKQSSVMEWSSDIQLPASSKLMIEAPKETYSEEVAEENLSKIRELFKSKEKKIYEI